MVLSPSSIASPIIKTSKDSDIIVLNSSLFSLKSSIRTSFNVSFSLSSEIIISIFPSYCYYSIFLRFFNSPLYIKNYFFCYRAIHELPLRLIIIFCPDSLFAVLLFHSSNLLLLKSPIHDSPSTIFID